MVSRVRKSSIELQIELLSACSVKHSQLAIQLIHGYIEFIENMVDLVFPVQNPQEFLLFWSEKDQYDACEFSKICILSETHRRSTIVDCVNMLKQTIKSWSSPHNKIRNQLNLCVLNVFQKMGLKEKIECVEYFTSTIRLERAIDDHLMACFVGIVRGVFGVYEKYMRNSIEIWQELQDFFLVSTKFIQKLTKIVELFKDNPLYIEMFNVTIEIVKCSSDNKNNDAIEGFQSECLNLLEMLLKKCEKPVIWYDKLRGFIKREFCFTIQDQI